MLIKEFWKKEDIYKIVAFVLYCMLFAGNCYN